MRNFPKNPYLHPSYNPYVHIAVLLNEISNINETLKQNEPSLFYNLALRYNHIASIYGKIRVKNEQKAYIEKFLSCIDSVNEKAKIHLEAGDTHQAILFNNVALSILVHFNINDQKRISLTNNIRNQILFPQISKPSDDVSVGRERENLNFEQEPKNLVIEEGEGKDIEDTTQSIGFEEKDELEEEVKQVLEDLLMQIEQNFRQERKLIKKAIGKLEGDILEEILSNALKQLSLEKEETERVLSSQKELQNFFNKMLTEILDSSIDYDNTSIKEVLSSSGNTLDINIEDFKQETILSPGNKKKKSPKKKKKHTENVDKLISEGEFFLEQKEFSSAIEKFYEAINLQKRDGLKKADIYYLLGQVYKEKGDFKEAIKAYQFSLKLFKDLHQSSSSNYLNKIDHILYQLADIYTSDASYDKAKACLQDVSTNGEIFPETAMFFCSLSKMYMKNEKIPVELKMELMFLSMIRAFQIIINFPNDPLRKEIENSFLKILHIVAVKHNYKPAAILEAIKKNIANYELSFKQSYDQLSAEEGFLKFISEKERSIIEKEEVVDLATLLTGKLKQGRSVTEVVFLNPVAGQMEYLSFLSTKAMKALIQDDKAEKVILQFNPNMVSHIYDNQAFLEFNWMNVGLFGINRAVAGSYQLKYIAKEILHLDYFAPDATKLIESYIDRIPVSTNLLYPVSLVLAVKPIINNNNAAHYVLASICIFLFKKSTHNYIQKLKTDIIASNPDKANENCKYISMLQTFEDAANTHLYKIFFPQNSFEPYPGYVLLTNAAIANVACHNYYKKTESSYNVFLILKIVPYIADFLIMKSTVGNLINFNAKIREDIGHIRYSEGLMKMIYVAEVYMLSNTLVTVDYVSKLVVSLTEDLIINSAKIALDLANESVIQPICKYMGGICDYFSNTNQEL